MIPKSLLEDFFVIMSCLDSRDISLAVLGTSHRGIPNECEGLVPVPTCGTGKSRLSKWCLETLLSS